MGGNRTSDPVSEFTRELLDRWQAEQKTFKALAKTAKLGPSLPSQIKARTSDVTNYSGPRLAQALLGVDYPEFVRMAYEWWSTKRLGDGEPLRRSARDQATAIAIRVGVQEDTLARVAESHSGPRFEHLETKDWLLMFLQEDQHERQSPPPPRPKSAPPSRRRRTGSD